MWMSFIWTSVVIDVYKPKQISVSKHITKYQQIYAQSLFLLLYLMIADCIGQYHLAYQYHIGLIGYGTGFRRVIKSLLLTAKRQKYIYSDPTQLDDEQHIKWLAENWTHAYNIITKLRMCFKGDNEYQYQTFCCQYQHQWFVKRLLFLLLRRPMRKTYNLFGFYLNESEGNLNNLLQAQQCQGQKLQHWNQLPLLLYSIQLQDLKKLNRIITS